MEKELKLVVSEISTGASLSQAKTGEIKGIRIQIEQNKVCLTPEQYKILYEKLEEIVELLNQSL